MAGRTHQLQPDVAAKYTCTIEPTRMELQWLRRTIDLRMLSLAEADELAADPRFTYLALRQQPKRAARRRKVD